jgi:AcrR family transcriptional regulator
MMTVTGLRERKKQQTYDALSEAAIALFLKRGFDEVSVTDIAEAANVSKPTLFKYFPTKQDLVLHRIADHRHEAARVVAAAGAPPVQALREHFLAGLTARDPITGLNDHPQVLAYYKLVFTTPALTTRLHQFMDDDEHALAEALGGDLNGELLAAQAVSVQRVLSRRNWEAITAGQRAADRYLDAVTEAETAFDGLPIG